MIHRFIIPGIIVGALHGGLFLIPNPTPLPPVKAGPEPVLVEFVPPPIPEIPIDIDDPPRGDEDNVIRPSVPLIPSTPSVAPIDPGVITDVFNFDLPRANIDPSALTVGLGDYMKQGLANGEGRGRLFSQIDLDKTPRTVFQVAPDYPYQLKNEGVTGTVTVVFTVDENGNVHDARVVSTSDTGFNDAALRAVSRWRFEPGRVQGKRVAFKMSVPIAFSLNEGE